MLFSVYQLFVLAFLPFSKNVSKDLAIFPCCAPYYLVGHKLKCRAFSNPWHEISKLTALALFFYQPASQNVTCNDSPGPREPSRQIQTLFVRPCGCLHDWVLSSICKHRHPQPTFSHMGQLQRGRLGCRSRGSRRVWFEAKLKQVHKEGDLQKVTEIRRMEISLPVYFFMLLHSGFPFKDGAYFQQSFYPTITHSHLS